MSKTLTGEVMAKRLGWEQAQREVEEEPPNPLVPVRSSGMRLKCDVVTTAGACGEPVAYEDSFRESMLCLVHARAIADLPDSVARTQMIREMTAQSLVNMSASAVTVLKEILEDPEVPSAVRLKASTEILDRTGFAKNTEITISTREESGPRQVSAADLIEAKINALAETVRTPLTVVPENPAIEDDSE